MDEAIKKLNEYRDWVIEHTDECYWTSEETIQECIDVLESELTAEEICEEQL